MAVGKRKRAVDLTGRSTNGEDQQPRRRISTRNITAAAATNPNFNGDVIDAPNVTRPSPDSDENECIVPGTLQQENGTKSPRSPSNSRAIFEPLRKKGRIKKTVAGEEEAKVIEKNGVAPALPKNGGGGRKARLEDADTETLARPKAARTPSSTHDEDADPEAAGDEEATEEEVKEALARPPPLNSDYLPLPWKGRLGFACLNTYLRQSNPPVFSSRTCRIQSILEHRYPLQDPSQPEHPTKNRPDRNQPADIELGKRYVESICLANVKDITKMIRWNDRYNIKFLRLSSEMFPFASHSEYGYKLAPFAAHALAEAGKVIAELGHRVTTHPGQFTQLGSPRKPVIENALRDLEYHDEMLTLLKLPEQSDRDAVMILHMGGIFEGKAETLQRFRENYARLPPSVKNRLVLENDDMGWSVHDLLPVCEELNIPLVLDFHHHNIVFDSTQLREGTKDIIDLYPRIKATWDRKGIKQKMHYSEPTPAAITPRQRRKHNPRVATLPPCPPDMDLMIEAKDKEQAVFELMRTFKLPGFDRFADVVPYVRNDDNKAALAAANKKNRSADAAAPTVVPDDEIGMGGPDGRVYWPPGMEEWLRPKKREAKTTAEPDHGKSKAQVKKAAAEAYAAREAAKNAALGGLTDGEEDDGGGDATPATKKARAAMRKKESARRAKATAEVAPLETEHVARDRTGKAGVGAGRSQKGGPANLTSDLRDDVSEPDPSKRDEEPSAAPVVKPPATAASRKTGGRKARAKRVSYAQDDDSEIEGA